MRAYVISTLFNKLFVFGCIFKKVLMHNFKVFRCITAQALIIAEITEKAIIRTYKIEVFE